MMYIKGVGGFIRADAAVSQLTTTAFGARVAASLSGARYSEIEYTQR